MPRFRFLRAVATVAGATAFAGFAVTARSADHLDSPAAIASPTADIADVYSWADGNNVVLAMTVYPNAPTGAKFDDKVQYVFHTASGAAFGSTTKTADVIVTFDASQRISAWLTSSSYQYFVTGDASSTTGLATPDGKFKVFAGLRADPFFFNLTGFKATVADVEGAGALPANDAGCPLLPSGTATALVNQLKAAPDGGAAGNFFATFNELAIVFSIDKSLLTSGGPVVSVWGATYGTPGTTADAGTTPADSGSTDAGGQ